MSETNEMGENGQPLDQLGRPVEFDLRQTPTAPRPAEEDPAYHGVVNFDDEVVTEAEVLADLPPDYVDWSLTQTQSYAIAYKKLSDSIREKMKAVRRVHDANIHKADLNEAIRQLTRAMGEAGGASTLERQAMRWITDGDAGQQRQGRLYVKHVEEVEEAERNSGTGTGAEDNK